MVQVHGHHFLAYLQDTAIETVAVLVHQGDNGTHVNQFLVKFAVGHEDVLVEFHDTVVHVVAIGVGFLDDEVETVVLVQVDEGFLEFGQRDAHASDKPEGLSLGALFYQLLLAVGVGIELVVHRNVFVVHKYSVY